MKRPKFRVVLTLTCVVLGFVVLSTATDKNAAELEGTWDYTSMTALKNGRPFGTVHFQPGQWTVTFNSDGTWSMKTPTRINPSGLKGSYQVHKHDLDMRLADGKPYGKYQLKFEQDGKVMVLTTKESTISATRE